MSNTVVSQSWVEDVQARLREQSAEIERLKAELASITSEKTTYEKAVDTLTRVVEKDQERLARLTPSGQVAEDRKHVATALFEWALTGHAGDSAIRAADRLAAKAQGYEAAVKRAEDAEHEKAEALRIGKQFEADARKHFEQSCTNLQRAEKAEHERDAAVADNAALLVGVQRIRNSIHSPFTGSERERINAIDRASEDALSTEHPGALLLKEKQEQAAAIKALADALKKSATRDDNGPCWCPPRTGPSPHEDYCAERRTALDMVGRLP